MHTLVTFARRLFGRPGPQPPPRYSVAQVLAVLRGETVPEQAAIERQLALLPVLLNDEAVQRRYRHFPRYLQVLPRILFAYRQGVPPAQLIEELDFLATEYGIRTVIEITAEVLAERLNQPLPGAGYPLANQR